MTIFPNYKIKIAIDAIHTAILLCEKELNQSEKADNIISNEISVIQIQCENIHKMLSVSD